MNNRICGECAHFDGRASCLHRHRSTWGGCEACSEYTERNKPTNGDRIRSMSDEELAELFVYKKYYGGSPHWFSTMFPNYDEYQYLFNTKQEAIEATLEELKKEVENESI